MINLKFVFTLTLLTWYGYAETQNTYWVSNDPSDAAVVQYSNLQTAIDDVEDGDTLMIYPTGISYGDINLTKPLFFESIGFQVNPFTQPALQLYTYNFEAFLNSLTINDAGNDIGIKGISISVISINDVSNLTISHCKIQAGLIKNSENVALLSNLIGGSSINISFYDRWHLRFENTDELLLSNNIFWQYVPESFVSNLYIDINCANPSLYNNIFSDDSNLSNCIFKNNIYISGSGACVNCEITNNIFAGTFGSNPPGNLYNINQASVFVGYPTQGDYSFDTSYQLLANSPAISYGVNGVDCGVFDGDFPYRLSGITDRPIISELEVPLTTYGDEMQITVRAKVIH
ncbi:MAG: hypothetical protein ABI761_13000 [Saprospiraceae bacterium]